MNKLLAILVTSFFAAGSFAADAPATAASGATSPLRAKMATAKKIADAKSDKTGTKAKPKARAGAKKDEAKKDEAKKDEAKK